MQGVPPTGTSPADTLAYRPEAPLRRLTDDELDSFHRDGVLLVKGLLTKQWLERGERAVDAMLRRATWVGWFLHKSSGQQGFSHEVFLWKQNDDARDFALYSPLAHIAQQCMGSVTVRLFYDQMFCKAPGCQAPTPWHQDLSFWPLTEEKPMQIVSFWIPFDPVTQANSGLRFVKGSHLIPQLFAAVSPDYSPLLLDPTMPMPPDVDGNPEWETVCYDMQPGDVYIFHPRVLHGSTANTTLTQNRRALAVRYLGDDVRYTPTGYTFPMPFVTGLKFNDHMHGALFPQVLPCLLREECLRRAHGIERPSWVKMGQITLKAVVRRVIIGRGGGNVVEEKQGLIQGTRALRWCCCSPDHTQP